MKGTATAVVLAAGFGSRLEGATDETALKPLTPVAGRPLLFRTLDGLAAAGHEDVVVVLGHGAADVEEAIRSHFHDGPTIHCIVNRRYDLSNGVSLLAASDLLRSPYILAMADHVFDVGTFELASRHNPPTGGATLVVDYGVREVFDLDDATKVLERDGRVIDIGKEIDEYNCIDTGLFIGTRGLLDALREVFEDRGDASLSEGVARLASRKRMTTLDIAGGFWQDVDTPEMLAEAERRLATQNG